MDKSYMRENNTVTLKIEDSGKEVILKKGDILQIELRTFGTAGYTWQFVDLDKEYLEIVSKKITPLSDRTGAPTLCTWHLRAMKTGVTKVAMSNYRVWEGKGKAVGEFLITVRIE